MRYVAHALSRMTSACSRTIPCTSIVVSECHTVYGTSSPSSSRVHASPTLTSQGGILQDLHVSGRKETADTGRSVTHAHDSCHGVLRLIASLPAYSVNLGPATSSVRVYYWSPYCTRLEPIFPRTLTDFARSARVVAWYCIVRPDCVATRTPPRAEYRASALAPFPPLMLFLFRGGGILFEIEWAETGRGRTLPLKGKACGSKCKIQMQYGASCLFLR